MTRFTQVNELTEVIEHRDDEPFLYEIRRRGWQWELWHVVLTPTAEESVFDARVTLVSSHPEQAEAVAAASDDADRRAER